MCVEYLPLIDLSNQVFLESYLPRSYSFSCFPLDFKVVVIGAGHLFLPDIAFLDALGIFATFVM